MFMLCLSYSTGKMQDNKNQERSTDEVQSTREYKKKYRLGMGVCVL